VIRRGKGGTASSASAAEMAAAQGRANPGPAAKEERECQTRLSNAQRPILPVGALGGR
jgi:hypothetical protein